MFYFIFVLELIGTAAFAVSGAIVGIRKSMDVFGVCILGLTTACGGGLIRDVILGELPPVMFSNSTYALVALGASVAVFLGALLKIQSKHRRLYDRLLLFADSLGLGIFTVVGVSAVYGKGFGGNLFFTMFLGTLTGVGGGLLRDVMSEQTPYIFVKHVYACASLLGAAACCGAWNLIGKNPAMLLGCAVVIAVRLLAARYHWSLPRIRG